MRLGCVEHDTAHELPPDDVARVVYALIGSLADCEDTPGPGEPGPEEPCGSQVRENLRCPLTVLEWSHEPEMYAGLAAEFLELQQAG